MRYLYGFALVTLLVACGGPTNNPKPDSGSLDVTVPDSSVMPDVMVIPDVIAVSPDTGTDIGTPDIIITPDTIAVLAEVGTDLTVTTDVIAVPDIISIPADTGTDITEIKQDGGIPDVTPDTGKTDTIPPVDTTPKVDTTPGPEVQVTPCTSNPCQNGGTCSVSGTSFVCACTAHRDPATSCATCSTGWTGADCNTPVVVDLCAGVVCDDSLFCNGTESCDPSTGKCIHQNVPSCGTHGSCNESTDSCSCDTNFGGPSCTQCAAGTIGTYPNCTADPCTPNPCGGNGGSCSVSGSNPVCACTGHWNSATLCTTCSAGWTGTDCNTPVVTDPCAGITCSNHGTCGAGICSCSTGYTGGTCNTCAAGYQGYPTCVPIPPPAPTISGLAIDCSSTGGECGGGLTYPVSWSFTNATSFTTSMTKVSGCTSTNGVLSPSSGTLTGSNTTINYTLGDCGPSTVSITVTVTGPSGQATSPPLNVIYF